MTNIASALKSEIARVARKEIRSETEGLKKLAAQQRGAIAQLRRQLAEVEKQLKQLRRASGSPRAGAPATAAASSAELADDGTPRRFSAARLAAHRTKLGISAADYGRLAGVSGATIYNWEQGKTRPARSQVQTLGLLKTLSPSAARERLAQSADGA